MQFQENVMNTSHSSIISNIDTIRLPFPWLKKTAYRITSKKVTGTLFWQLLSSKIPVKCCGITDTKFLHDRAPPYQTYPHLARLVFGWVTAFRRVTGWVTVSGQVYHIGMQPANYVDSALHPSGVAKSSSSFAWVKVGMLPLLGGR